MRTYTPKPGELQRDYERHRVWLETVQTCQQAYRRLADGLAAKFAHIDDKTLRRKKAREAARSVLPNATETKIFFTGNARALRHFIELRGSEHADVEIRNVALAMLEIMRREAPAMFSDYEIRTLPDGTTAVFTEHPKV